MRCRLSVVGCPLLTTENRQRASAPKGVLEAQIQNHRTLSRTRADADWESDRRHDLQAGGVVIRPAHGGADRQEILVISPLEQSLDHQIEALDRPPDDVVRQIEKA